MEFLQVDQIDPCIATGRAPHNRGWRAPFSQSDADPEAEANLKERMVYKLRTTAGRAIYRLRECTVEPVIGILKEAMGIRQFSLRGQENVTHEWCLVCLAYNLQRLHTLRGI